MLAELRAHYPEHQHKRKRKRNREKRTGRTSNEKLHAHHTTAIPPQHKSPPPFHNDTTLP